jgi:hypothetical protein
LGSWQMFFPYPSTKENGDFNNLCCWNSKGGYR